MVAGSVAAQTGLERIDARLEAIDLGTRAVAVALELRHQLTQRDRDQAKNGAAGAVDKLPGRAGPG
jgi:hypothetical protein